MMNGVSRMSAKLTAIIEHDEDRLLAYCPDLPGRHSQGDTFEDALSNIREAAMLYVGHEAIYIHLAR